MKKKLLNILIVIGLLLMTKTIYPDSMPNFCIWIWSYPGDCPYLY